MSTSFNYRGADRIRDVYFSPMRVIGERAAEIAAQGHDVVYFSIGEPDFDTPSSIKEATIRALQENKTHYASNRGTLALRKEIATQLKAASGLDYDPAAEILVTAGGAEAINNSLLAIINPGDEVIVFTPAFMNYENLISMCGGTMVPLELKSGNGFQPDPEELKDLITDKTRLIILNNPSNPTGAVYSREVLAEIARLAVEHDIMVFSDEIYNQIVYDGAECPSIAAFPGMMERTITMNGFSKTYAMTGWRMGYVAAEKKVLSDILKVHQYTTTCIPTFAQEGLARAMNTPEVLSDVARMRDAFDNRRKLLMSGLDRIGKLKYTVPQGAFYIFVDVSGTGMDGDEFASRLLEEHYVATIPGSRLEARCRDFIRISYATGSGRILEGLRRIDSLINGK